MKNFGTEILDLEDFKMISCMLFWDALGSGKISEQITGAGM